MGKLFVLAAALVLIAAAAVSAAEFQSDTFKTAKGDLVITFIGHGTLMMAFGGKTIHIDPVSGMADYSKLPKADLVLVTHEHSDHLDLKAIDRISKKGTKFVATETVAGKLKGATVLKNGDTKTVLGLKIEAVPAYNMVHMRSPGMPFHPKGIGNGYVVTFGGKRVYMAGDTENTPEMKALKNIDIAFLPMNLPYTMTPEMVADAAKAFRPKVLYPYHYGDTDPQKLAALLKGDRDIEVRVRNLK
jgi:L-ascorbate metabolism protein UlaG (beta-lactamase superfamily)